jgi:hypothetical protein
MTAGRALTAALAPRIVRPMRLTLLAALLCAVALVATPRAQTNVAGTWDLTADGPQGTSTLALTIEQEGTALGGSIATDMGSAEVKGEVAGTALQVSFDLQTSQGTFPIVLTGVVDGDAIKGSINYGQGTAPFTGTRKK